ncbi:MAG: hypothetical protein AAB526_00375 [Patescibacteria group bacterium]
MQKNNIKFRQSLFWDTNLKNIDVKKHAQYIIERVADFGDDKEARWVLDFYNKKLLKKVITKSRCLRPRTKTLWTLILNK